MADSLVPTDDLPEHLNGLVPSHDLPDHAVVPGAEVPADDLPVAAKYGSGPQQALAGIEGVLRGASLGLSDIAETKLAGVPAEEIKGRQEANPWTSIGGAGLGGAGLAALTGGGSLIAEGLGGGAIAGAIGLGTEGAVFGAGNAVSDYALGDPELNGQKVLSHIGMGGLFGGALGAIAGKFGAFAPKIMEAGAEGALAGADDAARLIGMEAEAVPAGPVTSFADLQERIAQAQSKGLTYELPQKSALVEAASRLPDLDVPLIPQQIDALNSKSALDAYKIAFREGDSEVAKAVQNLEGLQKAALVRKTDETIAALSPEIAPIANKVTGGARAIEAFTEQYQAEKKALGPLFDQLDNINLGELRADIVPLMEKFAEKIPNISRMFKYGEDGLLEGVLPHNPQWGVSTQAYRAVKRVFQSLEKGAEEPASFGDLLNLRKYMDEFVNPLSVDEGPAQIRGLKAAFMDYIQGLADEHIPDMSVRDLFKRYAINEQDRQIIEKTFGASVGSKDLSFMPKNPSEDILGKMFRDTETVKAAKRILDPAKFDELLANHLAAVRDSFTKNGVFSSNRFASYLKQHAAELGGAFSDRPADFQRLKDLATVSTIIPDAASINPSGSAKTMMGLLKNVSVGEMGLGVLNPKFLIGIIGKKAVEMLKESHAERSAVAEFNSGLAGKSAKLQSLEKTQKMLSAFNAQLDRSVKAIFKQEEPEHAR